MRRLTQTLIAAAALSLAALPALAETIRIGVSTGAHAQIMEQVRALAKPAGLDIQIIEFTDYVVPNAALAAGDLEANSFQHQPYLDNQIADRGYDLISVGKTVTVPLGLYSHRIKALTALPDGARVAIPNDPTNGGRALLLLDKFGLLTLRPGAGLTATPLDIAANPKRLRIIELDAAQLPRALDDVDLAAINGDYALEAGLVPTRDALGREDANSPYANVIAVRPADRDAPWVKTLLTVYHSDAVKTFIEQTFKGALIPAW